MLRARRRANAQGISGTNSTEKQPKHRFFSSTGLLPPINAGMHFHLLCKPHPYDISSYPRPWPVISANLGKSRPLASKSVVASVGGTAGGFAEIMPFPGCPSHLSSSGKHLRRLIASRQQPTGIPTTPTSAVPEKHPSIYVQKTVYTIYHKTFCSAES